MTARYPELLPASHHDDLRGRHSKFFGDVPELIAVPGYEIREVFMTTSRRNVVRGMHFQRPPQPKIIQVVSGEIHCQVVACDPGDADFGSASTFHLNEGGERLLVPGTCALGYRALLDGTRVLYLAGSGFVANGDTGIDPFDADLALDWGPEFDLTQAVLSDRDQSLQSFADYAKSVGR
jgi:dTDP-4-dehydrorhamnose 3,5-epimerase-like enzyme